MKNPVYTPILKTKRGETKALTLLSPEISERIIPFFDVLALKHDVSNGNDVHEHLTKQALHIASAWKNRGLCYVDLFDVIPAARGINGAHPAKIVHDKITSERVQAIPVVGLGRDIAYKLAIRSIVTTSAEAIAVRLETEDLQLPSTLLTSITKLVSEIGAADLPLHIFMDFRSIESTPTDQIQSQVTRAIYALRRLNPARIVFSASAFVASMGKFKRNTLNRVKRIDFLTWNLISELHHDIDYADYGVVHPDYFDLDPRLIKPSAKIRYTSDKEWLVVKGSCWRDDTSQHHTLSKVLQEKPDFRGSDCWGSEYITSAAAGRPKYGSLETWVTIDQNTHITHTVRQLSRITTNTTVSA